MTQLTNPTPATLDADRAERDWWAVRIANAVTAGRTPETLAVEKFREHNTLVLRTLGLEEPA